MPELDAEVVVIGGGLVGSTCAAILAREGVDCIVIDAAKAKTASAITDTDPRALALTPASRQIFQSFGLWKQIPEDKLGHFRKIYVWDENGTGKVEFDCADICEPTLGYIIQQSVLQETLDKVLEYIPSLLVYRETFVNALHWNENSITVELDDRKLNTKLVIAADGIHSHARTLAGIEYHVHDYEQQALASVVNTSLPHEQIARQRFMSNGPLAFLPMVNSNQCGIVWSVPPTKAQQLADMEVKKFNYELQSAFENTLGDVLESGPRACFPLCRAQAERYCRERFVLIGDAAHSVHPLAGQGANLGLLDAASLAEVLFTTKHKQKDIGTMQVLRRYERWRKGENRIMMTIFEGFKYLFENQTRSLSMLRNSGMDFVNSKTIIRNFIMRRATGLEGDLPDLAK